jgi:hypothetical protein
VWRIAQQAAARPSTFLVSLFLMSVWFQETRPPDYCLLCKPFFCTRREGDDLIFSKRVSLSEALCGTEFTVQTLDGRTLNISTQDSIVQSGSQKVMR